MKKVSFILGAMFLMTIALSSCKKDYTCECTTAGVKTSIPIAKTTKKLATDACNALNIGTTTCELN